MCSLNKMTQQLILSDAIVIVKSPTLIPIGRREREMRRSFVIHFTITNFFIQTRTGLKVRNLFLFLTNDNKYLNHTNITNIFIIIIIIYKLYKLNEGYILLHHVHHEHGINPQIHLEESLLEINNQLPHHITSPKLQFHSSLMQH